MNKYFAFAVKNKSNKIFSALLFIMIVIFVFYSIKVENGNTRANCENNLKAPDNLNVFYFQRDSAAVKHYINCLKPFYEIDKNHDLILPKGMYKIGDHCYSLEKEGLYRIFSFDGYQRQFIVFDNDLFALISAMSWIITHGNLDNKLEFAELESKASCSKLSLTCYHSSLFIKQILDRIKIPARIVAGINIDDRDGFDDGHNMIEVYSIVFNKWVVFDIDTNSYFTLNSIPLSFIEVFDNLSNTDLLIESLSKDIKADIAFGIDKKNYSFYMEFIFNNQLQWYKKVLQVPLIQENKSYYFYDVIDSGRVKEYSKLFTYIDKSEFFQRFYKN